jgi:hypothetical protein
MTKPTLNQIIKELEPVLKMVGYVAASIVVQRGYCEDGDEAINIDEGQFMLYERPEGWCLDIAHHDPGGYSRPPDAEIEIRGPFHALPLAVTELLDVIQTDLIAMAMESFQAGLHECEEE